MWALQSRKVGKVQDDDVRPPSNVTAAQPPDVPPEVEIRLSDLPPALAAKLAHLDLDGDGIIDVAEITSLDKAADAANAENTFLHKMIIVGVMCWLLQIVAVFAVSYGSALVATPYTLAPNGVMMSKSGALLQTANADSCVLDGVMTSRAKDGTCPTSSDTNLVPIKTAPSSSKSALSSDHPDVYFESLSTVNLVSDMAHHLQLKVNGFMRNASDESVKLYTDYGFVLLTNSSFTVVDKTDLRVFADAGFTSGNRVKFASLDYDATSQFNRRRLASSTLRASSNVAGSAPARAPAPPSLPVCTYRFNNRDIAHILPDASGSFESVIVDWAAPCAVAGAGCVSAYPVGATAAVVISRTYEYTQGRQPSFHVVLSYKGSTSGVTNELTQFDVLGVVFDEKLPYPAIDQPLTKLTKDSRQLLVPSEKTYRNVVGMNTMGIVYNDRLYERQKSLPTQLGSCSLCLPHQCLALAAAAKLYKLSGSPIGSSP